MLKRFQFAILIVVLLAAIITVIGLVSYSSIFPVSNTRCKGSVATYSGVLPSSGFFIVQVNYSGPWIGEVKTYNSLGPYSSALQYNLCFSGTGNKTALIPTWNVNGEQTTWVVASKLDSSSGNLTVTVGYGEYFRSNCTVIPHGTAETYVATTP